MKYPSIRDLETGGKRVFLRVDLNVPLEYGHIMDDNRIRAMIPTLRNLLDQGSPVILASHMGRPEGNVVPDLSLRPVADKLSSLLRM